MESDGEEMVPKIKLLHGIYHRAERGNWLDFLKPRIEKAGLKDGTEALVAAQTTEQTTSFRSMETEVEHSLQEPRDSLFQNKKLEGV